MTRKLTTCSFVPLLLLATCSTPNSEASNVTSQYADDWKPPEDISPNKLNDTCYNKDNCEACWKDDCFSQADEVYGECLKNVTDYLMNAMNNKRTEMNRANATEVPEDAMNNTNATQVPEAAIVYNDTSYCYQLGTETYQECGHSCLFCNQDLKACSTSQLLDTIDLRLESNQWANAPAPAPWVAFCIGGAFCFAAAIHWIFRFFKVLRCLDKSNRKKKAVLFRSALVTLGDDDEPLFTILRTFSQGFLLLGGFQLNYQLTFRVLLVAYFFVSLRDTFRVLVAYNANKKVEDFVVVPSKGHKKKGVVAYHQPTGQQGSWIELKTKNIYENLSRDFLVVGMVFTTQALLIAFVVIDVYNDKDSHTNIAGTETVPVVGTNSSYCIYILGIFMSVVYLVGPKTNFGQSKENPHYWVQLLLIAKLTGATCKWHNPVKGQAIRIQLRPGDKRIWLRFFLSFLVNGWGYHVLVHLLPIQVAAESSFTGVVFRAVGMMYLIDLDDTPSVTLTLHEGLGDYDDNETQQEVAGDTNANVASEEDNLLGALGRESSLMQSKILEMQHLQHFLASSIANTSQMALDPIVENVSNNVANGQGHLELAPSMTITNHNDEDILHSSSSFRTNTTANPIGIFQQNFPIPSNRAAARGNNLLDLANLEPEESSADSPADRPAQDPT